MYYPDKYLTEYANRKRLSDALVADKQALCLHLLINLNLYQRKPFKANRPGQVGDNDKNRLHRPCDSVNGSVLIKSLSLQGPMRLYI